MREDIVFEELIEQIDLILNSSKPLGDNYDLHKLPR